MTHKCPNCKALGHRVGYCTKCAAIYRKVRRFMAMNEFDWHTKAINTPAGFVYVVEEPDAEVVAWLTKRDKMPDMEARRDSAKVRTIRSILSA